MAPPRHLGWLLLDLFWLSPRRSGQPSADHQIAGHSSLSLGPNNACNNLPGSATLARLPPGALTESASPKASTLSKFRSYFRSPTRACAETIPRWNNNFKPNTHARRCFVPHISIHPCPGQTLVLYYPIGIDRLLTCARRAAACTYSVTTQHLRRNDLLLQCDSPLILLYQTSSIFLATPI